MVRLRKHSHRSPSHISFTNSTNWGHVVCHWYLLPDNQRLLFVVQMLDNWPFLLLWFTHIWNRLMNFHWEKNSKTNIIGSNSWKDKLERFWLHNDALLKWLTEPKKKQKKWFTRFYPEESHWLSLLNSPEVLESCLSFFAFLLLLSWELGWEFASSPLLFSPTTPPLATDDSGSPLLLFAGPSLELAVSSIIGRLLPESSFSCKTTKEPASGLGPVSQKLRIFSGLFRVPQSLLYFRNAEVLSHQTSQSFWCFMHEKHVKRSALQNKWIAIWQLALLSYFSFYFLNACQSDNSGNKVYVLGHKYILGELILTLAQHKLHYIFCNIL